MLQFKYSGNVLKKSSKENRGKEESWGGMDMDKGRERWKKGREGRKKGGSEGGRETGREGRRVRRREGG